jgi:[ribosomal protein S18]-alanine N-acetyltransferase
LKGQAISPYRLRRMEPEDIDQVGWIEREAFPTLWPHTSYRRELKNHLAMYLVCVQTGEYEPQPPKVVVTGGFVQRVLGWLGLAQPVSIPSAPRERITGFIGLWKMADEAHIVAVAVRESHRRKGLGELLLLGGIEMAMEAGMHAVTLEARVSNWTAHALYEKYGFRHMGVRKAYYSDNREDAVIMTTSALTSEGYRTLLDALREQFEERYGEAERAYS